jgi:hypothetical protein
MRYLTLLLMVLTAYPAAAAPLKTGLTDDAYPVIEYAGSWSDVTQAGAIAGAYQQADSLADTVTLETYATGFTLFFWFDPAGGAVDVCVDSVDCVNVSTTGAAAPGKIEIIDLAAGLKEITVTKSVDDSSVFNFDGVYIHPAGSDVNVISFEYAGETFSASLPLEITSGDFLIVILLAVIAAFQVIRFSLDVRSQNE